MPHTDASANTDTVPVTEFGTTMSPLARESRIGPATDVGADAEDTLDLRLPDDFVAFCAEGTGGGGERSPGAGTGTPAFGDRTAPDLLGSVVDWGPVSTAAGLLHLVPARIDQDVPIISRWMNDPAVTAFWGLAGSENATEDHLSSQLFGDGRSVPCLGVLGGTPMSYWEIYRADLDPLARHYPARPHDIGVHLLIGAAGDRGRGLGATLLRAVADHALDQRPACARIVAEPDIRNTPSVAAFLSAGFRFAAEIDLPAKRAALMIRDRSLRHLL
ncbi:GNAT family N-acetyltransferase [Streptomyces sp. NPDC093568]|uniref:GNAT family N-acetyltransferase n=1 Tax=Streptomyces sp. NPDC093568 TaxID=3366041 RepID=UPI0037FC71E6